MYTQAEIRNKFKFGYAKQQGVLLVPSDESGYDVFYRSDTKPDVFLELLRYIQEPCTYTELPDSEFEQRLSKYYESHSEVSEQFGEDLADDLDFAEVEQSLHEKLELLDSHDDAPIIRLINAIIAQAVSLAASDVHVEPLEEHLIVRCRVDGVLQQICNIQRKISPLVVSRIKVMSKLDIAEKRLPQDGRMTIRIGGRAIDIRVSTMPSNHGERVVLRLLDKSQARLDLKHLGMSDTHLDQMRKLIREPHGILLVTGPTGSGKTTSLYASLTELNEESRNILTIEDPIEYDLPGIGQTQVNAKIDMTFAKGLRAILRQDPDVVMIGEIRDLETAKIAVQASLTGHLVLATLHTNTALGAVARLRDMGIESYLLASSLIAVQAQRLVRRLCPGCKQPVTLTDDECRLLHIKSSRPVKVFAAKGCDACHQMGYKGRIGIYEVVGFDDHAKRLIHDGASSHELSEYCHQRFSSIMGDAVEKVLSGETSIDEVLRVCSVETLEASERVDI